MTTDTTRRLSLFRNGRNQALRIPRDFELDSEEVILRKEDGRLIIEPVPRRKKLKELLDEWEPLEEEFPDIEDVPVKPEDVF
ncbi:antitoxin VapB [Methylomarinovum caldicuralii]|uniref:Antitoxin VapB n=1 Tax=Methylomarinovum caldicuralii TaxID=438856 RepID=A0AAU9C290_9GAMM|nr:hypothetical protein [Methylomarinovum caldicuralii]BCX82502.1 antitoxin VapB [Methylomarinovum caldicuralii]